jgi:hypothetical protein
MAIKKTVTQDEFTESDIQSIIDERLKTRELNEVKLAFIVNDKSISQGKEKVDKDGNLIFDNSTGEPLRWQDSYYVTIDFVGGSLAIRVKQDQFNTLEEGSRYVGLGLIGTRTINNFSSLDVQFKSFEKIS